MIANQIRQSKSKALHTPNYIIPKLHLRGNLFIQPSIFLFLCHLTGTKLDVALSLNLYDFQMSWWNILRIYLHRAIIGTKLQKHKQKQMKLPPWGGLPLLPRTSLLVCLVIFGSVTPYVILHSKVIFFLNFQKSQQRNK